MHTGSEVGSFSCAVLALFCFCCSSMKAVKLLQMIGVDNGVLLKIHLQLV